MYNRVMRDYDIYSTVWEVVIRHPIIKILVGVDYKECKLSSFLNCVFPETLR